MEDTKELEQLLQAAIDSGHAPPKEFVEAVMIGKITIPPAFMDQMVDLGWIPRRRCEIWSRVMGYYRPVSQWNIGKKAEYAERNQIDPRDIDYKG